MNYFSHFYFDHLTGNHEYNTGLILPDFTRKWIKKRIPEKPDEINIHQQSFAGGWMRHHFSDKLFHASHFFEFHHSLLNEMMKKSDMSDDAERKWFLAHVAFELLIDRMIVKYNRTSLDEFYYSLNNADRNSLTVFLNLQGMDNADDFFRIFDHFRTVQYIYYYTDNNKFVYSLNKIMLRAKLNELSAEDAFSVTEVIIDFESKYLNDPKATIRQIENIFR